nr:uncharacterized protein LOC107453843 isoform X2 [Parasteatoda tepidariorum]
MFKPTLTTKRERTETSKMIGKLFFLIFMCGIGLSSQDANSYMDAVIKDNLHTAVFKAGLDPASISDFETKFGVQDIYGNVGEAIFSRGNLTRLDRARRRGDCTGPTKSGQTMLINCTIGLTQLITEYKVIIRNGSHIYLPRNMGHVSETVVSLEIAGLHPLYRGSLKKLKVDKVGQITPTFSGLPAPLNKYLKVLQDAYRTHVSAQIHNILQNNYALALDAAFRNVSMSAHQ